MVLASPCTLSAICISVRAFNRYAWATMAAAGFLAQASAEKRLSPSGAAGVPSFWKLVSAPFHMAVAWLM